MFFPFVERLMNVHKFDIRLPPFRSGAGEGELDAAARDERKLWTRGVIPYMIDNTIRKYHSYFRIMTIHSWLSLKVVGVGSWGGGGHASTV